MVGSIGRLITPRSPGGNAFDVVEDSDDDGTELANGDDMFFAYGNLEASVDTVIEFILDVWFMDFKLSF